MNNGGPPQSSSQGGSAFPPSIFEEVDFEADTDTGRISLPPMSRRPAPSATRAMLTVMSGVHAGRAFVLDKPEMLLGRSREAHVQLEDHGISRRHARLVRTPSGDYRIEDVGSTNGLYVNGLKVALHELREGDRVQIGPALLLRFSRPDALEEELATALYEASTRDALTGLYNRKYFTSRVEAEVAFAERHGTKLGVIIFDIDHFKRINDTYGHAAGDAVLRRVASRVERSIRREDVLARWGGEEFALVLRGLDLRGLASFGERIRRGVEALAVNLEGHAVGVTISVGVASLDELDARNEVGTGELTDPGIGSEKNRATALTLAPPIVTPHPPHPSHGRTAFESLLGLADARLYGGKSAGRNRVVSS